MYMHFLGGSHTIPSDSQLYSVRYEDVLLITLLLRLHCHVRLFFQYFNNIMHGKWQKTLNDCKKTDCAFSGATFLYFIHNTLT